MAGGLGDVPPENLKRGKLPAPVTLPPSGTQGVSGPSANEGGEKGVQGGKAPWRGVWGVSPHETLKGESCHLLQTRLRVGLKALANPQQTRAGKNWRARGIARHGVWGMCPHKTLKGESC